MRLSALPKEDRDKLSLLFRTRGDPVSFASLREEDPLETLLWLGQPHIKPWHEIIQAAHRNHEQTETRLALARALKDITRILDLEADSTLRIRAVNAIIRLANAIHRCNRATDRGASAVAESGSPPREHTELHRAHDNAETAVLRLTTHLERRGRRTTFLQDAKAPVGAAPTPFPDPPPIPVNSIRPMPPMFRMSPTSPVGLADPTPSTRSAHVNGKVIARAGAPRPPPKKRRRSSHRAQRS